MENHFGRFVQSAAATLTDRMDKERLSKLQAEVRIGGKVRFCGVGFDSQGTPRRKKKVVHKTSVTDEKKLQSVLKKIGANSITGIEEVDLFARF